jgi:DNA-binding HxlR family transcriptional regulator
MAATRSSSQVRSSLEAEALCETQSIPELLRLLGAGATGSILLALGEGPLRTKELTARVPGYAPRTVYRYVSRLVEIGAIEREEEPGVPSKVVHHLTDPCGVELCELVDAYGQAALEVLPDGGIVPHSWGSVTLMADLWESGMFGEMNGGPCTATELARVGHDLSFHQVSRRTNLYLIGGLIREASDGGRRRRYELTEEARKATVLIAGLGRWRERYVVPAGEAGLTIVEAAQVLRAALALVVLPVHAGKRLELAVVPAGRSDGQGGEVVRAEVRAGGAVVDRVAQAERADGWGRGEVGGWLEALAVGARSGVRVGGGDCPLIKACLRSMHEALWKGQENGAD